MFEKQPSDVTVWAAPSQWHCGVLSKLLRSKASADRSVRQMENWERWRREKRERQLQRIDAERRAKWAKKFGCWRPGRKVRPLAVWEMLVSGMEQGRWYRISELYAIADAVPKSRVSADVSRALKGRGYVECRKAPTAPWFDIARGRRSDHPRALEYKLTTLGELMKHGLAKGFTVAPKGGQGAEWSAERRKRWLLKAPGKDPRSAARRRKWLEREEQLRLVFQKFSKSKI